MRQFNQKFSKETEVRQALSQLPKMLEFRGMSREVKALYITLNEHCDAMVGYASWYLQKKTPNTAEQAFLPKDVWVEIKQLENRCQSDADRNGIKGAKELAEFIEKLTSLIFI